MPRLLRGFSLVLSLLAIARGADGTDWWLSLRARDLNGTATTAHGRWIVVVFLSPECPVANASIPTLNALAAEFSARGVDFVGAYADPTQDLPALRRHAAEFQLKFATVDDRQQRVVRATGATYTPEVFVYSRRGELLYRGRIDDRVEDLASARPKATHEELREVLVALAAGQAGPFANRPGFGCAIPELVRR